MAPLITHLVIGERVFRQLRHFDPTPTVYGSFLLGCLLVDANHFSDVDRRQTHFVGRLDEDGADAFEKSCANFLRQLDGLLLRPWDDLTPREQAFVAGYLCHLTADETWKAFTWRLLQTLDITSWVDFPLPGEVVLTVVSVLSSRVLTDLRAVAAALNDASIPHVLTHVPHDAFQNMWDITQAYALDGRTRESYFDMLERAGKTSAEIEAVRQQHDLYWEGATALIHEVGGVEPYIQNASRHAMRVVSQLWTSKTQGRNNPNALGPLL